MMMMMMMIMLAMMMMINDDGGGDDDYDNDSLRSLLASLWTRVCGEARKLSGHLEPLLVLGD